MWAELLTDGVIGSLQAQGRSELFSLTNRRKMCCSTWFALLAKSRCNVSNIEMDAHALQAYLVAPADMPADRFAPVSIYVLLD